MAEMFYHIAHWSQDPGWLC